MPRMYRTKKSLCPEVTNQDILDINLRNREKDIAQGIELGGFPTAWTISIKGEPCGNPFVSKCPGKQKFKKKEVCLINLDSRVAFHFPECYFWAVTKPEELPKPKARKAAVKKEREEEVKRLS